MSSSGPVLYEFHPSYYSQMARMALVENGVPFQRKNVNILQLEQYQPEFIKINPACEVPALVVDGKTINGSQAIIEYAEKHKGKAVDPKIESLRKRCFELPIVEMSFGLLYHPEILPGLGELPAGIKGAYEALGKREDVLKEMIKKYPECKSAYEEKLSRVQAGQKISTDINGAKKSLQEVEKFLDDLDAQLKSTGGQQWILGQDFTSADVNVAVLLARLEMSGIADKLFNSSRRSNVAEYYQRLKQRPSFKQVQKMKNPVSRWFGDFERKAPKIILFEPVSDRALYIDCLKKIRNRLGRLNRCVVKNAASAMLRRQRLNRNNRLTRQLLNCQKPQTGRSRKL